MAEGGTPRPTANELERLAFFHKSAEEFGWTDKPAWVAEPEEWMAQLES